MRYASDEASRRLYTEFLTRHDRCNFQQSVEWARVKSNWKNEIILAEDAQGNITGGLSVLIRRIPLFGNLMYSPRGPICDTNDAETLRQLMEGAELLSWKYNAMALRMEPDVRWDDSAFRAIVQSLGCRTRDGVRSARDTIQPRSVFRLDIKGKTEQEVMAGFHQKLRYNIRLAQRRGVEIREGTREDLAAFHALMAETARRDRFLARPLSYFERVWDELGPEHTTLLLACFNGRPIAGVMPIFYGNKTWYAFGARSGEHGNLMPCHLLQWEMIRRAIARGDDVYDLRGFLEITDENDPHSGLYQFKRRFGGELTRVVGEVYAPYKPVTYWLYRHAERLYMALRSTLHSTGRPAQPRPDTPQPRPWDSGTEGARRPAAAW